MKDIDPIEELHKIRWAICKKAGGAPADYVRHYLEMDKKNVEASRNAEAKPAGKSKTAKRKPGRKTAKAAAKSPTR